MEIIQDKVFGELNWEEKYNWWKGKFLLQPNLEIDVRLDGVKAEIAANITQFQLTFEKFCINEPNARIYAAEKLLKIHNDSWRDDDEEIVTTQEFCQGIKPESIIIYDELNAEIYYQDDDLFWGHVIIVSIDENGEFSDATIAG